MSSDSANIALASEIKASQHNTDRLDSFEELMIFLLRKFGVNMREADPATSVDFNTRIKDGCSIFSQLLTAR